jgi:ribosomal protein S18 acetylase RimI-like enzyme
LASEPNDKRVAKAMRIRQATTSDAHGIAEIVVRGWQTAYRAILPDDFLAGLSVGAREVAWRMRLESSADAGDSIWVAEVAGAAIGFVSCGPPRDKHLPSRAAEIYAIYVDPTSWRRGAGRALLQTATTHLRSLGTEILVLWVLEENAAGRAFYEAMGWRPDGARQLLDFGGFMVPEVRYGLTP